MNRNLDAKKKRQYIKKSLFEFLFSITTRTYVKRIFLKHILIELHERYCMIYMLKDKEKTHRKENKYNLRIYYV